MGMLVRKCATTSLSCLHGAVTSARIERVLARKEWGHVAVIGGELNQSCLTSHNLVLVRRSTNGRMECETLEESDRASFEKSDKCH
jgi:hypothetical protein